MPLQILSLKLDGITAGDYLTWCRDPDPLALDVGLRSITIDADPLGDTITAILDWTEPVPPALTAAPLAGLPLAAGVQIHRVLTDSSQPGQPSIEAGPHPTRFATGAAGGRERASDSPSLRQAAL